MFRIELVLKNNVSKSGCDALDFCRQFGLEEVANVYTNEFARVTECTVPEEFARAWFKPDSTTEKETVDVSMLKCGEIVFDKGYHQRIRISPELSYERIKELWIAARFRRLSGR